MIKITKTIFYTITSLGAIGIVVIPSVMLFQYFKKEDNLKIDSRERKLDWSDVEIEEHAIKGQYHFNDSVWQKISDRLKNDLNRGPEFNSLKKIIFGSDAIIESTANGFYSPNTKTMVINIENFLDRVYIDETNDTFADEFIELMFQTIFHEYGHHVAATYFNVLPLNNREAYIANSNTWIQGFATGFRDSLNYDKDTSKVSSQTLYHSNGYNIKSIGSLYDAQDIFTVSNPILRTEDTKNLPLNENNNIFMFIGEEFSRTTDMYNFNNPSVVNHFTSSEYIKYVTYLFDFDELFTRKYQQLKYIYNPTNLNSKFLGNLGWGLNYVINSSGKQNGYIISNTVGGDRRNYETQTDDGQWKKYLSDAVFDDNNNVNQELEDIYSEVIGYKTNVDLSFIWANNDINLSNDGKYLLLGDKNKLKEIKFGGYLNNTEEYTHISFQNDDSEWVHLPITVEPHFSGFKDNVEAITYSNESETRKQYWINDWIHQDEIKEKVLYFSNGNDITDTDSSTISRPFATTRDDSSAGYATNHWIGTYWGITGDNLIKGTKDSEGIKISKWEYVSLRSEIENEYLNNPIAIKKVNRA